MKPLARRSRPRMASQPGHRLPDVCMADDRNLVTESVKNIFSIPDLRWRILFMLAMLAVYRVGSFVPVPGIDPRRLEELFTTQGGGTIFGFFDIFVGGNLRRFSIFALGIMPYITSSIILQLLTPIVPYLEKLSKEGELGRKKINQYTRYLTVVLTMVQGLMIAVTFDKSGIALNSGWGFRLMTMLTLATGTSFIMWIGEQITERGIGNGISLIIFAGIVAGLPRAISEIWIKVVNLQEWSIFHVLFLMVLMVTVVAGIVFVERGQRRVPIQHAKRIIGRRVYGGQSTYLPLRVNSGGVIPVIFAAAIISLPATLAQLIPWHWFKVLIEQLRMGMPLYNLIYITGIIFFTFFYVSIVANPNEWADNFRKSGAFIPGIRPGTKTAEYIEYILNRLTMAGAVYLVLVCLLPEFLISGFRLNALPPWLGGDWFDRYLPQVLLHGLGVTFYFGGTSLLIVVGVAMDTLQQIESQLIMRHYEGFLKKGRIRGRRV